MLPPYRVNDYLYSHEHVSKYDDKENCVISVCACARARVCVCVCVCVNYRVLVCAAVCIARCKARCEQRRQNTMGAVITFVKS